MDEQPTNNPNPVNENPIAGYDIEENPNTTKKRKTGLIIGLILGVILIPLGIWLAIIAIISKSISNPAEKNIITGGIDYVEKKYNTSCEFIRGAPGNATLAAGINNIIVRCEGLSVDEIMIARKRDSNRNWVYVGDNYFKQKFANETLAFLNSHIRKFFGAAAVFYEVSLYDYSEENLPINTTFEDYLAQANLVFNVASNSNIGRGQAEARLAELFESMDSISLITFIMNSGDRQIITSSEFASERNAILDGYSSSETAIVTRDGSTVNVRWN